MFQAEAFIAVRPPSTTRPAPVAEAAPGDTGNILVTSVIFAGGRFMINLLSFRRPQLNH
jgi:hypothetical protein